MYKSYTIPTTKTIRSRSRSHHTATSTDFEKIGTARRHITNSAHWHVKPTMRITFVALVLLYVCQPNTAP